MRILFLCRVPKKHISLISRAIKKHGKENFIIEEIDSDGGSADFGGGDHNSFDIVEQNINGMEGTDANSKNADNTTLDGIFGSICQDDAEISLNPLQIANLFDEECHKSCSVGAPPGMELLDDSDGNSESSISISALYLRCQ